MRISDWSSDVCSSDLLDDLVARSRQAVARGQLLEHLRPQPLLQLGNTPQHRAVVHPEALGGGSDRAPTRDGKKVANVIPVDHGAIPHRGVRPSKIRTCPIEQPYGRITTPHSTNPARFPTPHLEPP